jgi:hypothetical protein
MDTPRRADAQIRGIGEIGHDAPPNPVRCGKSRPVVGTAGRGAREHAPDPADIQASGDELAVVWKGRDSLADNDRQLLMPSRRDLLGGGASQKRLDRFKSLLLGRAGFDRDCKLGEVVGEVHRGVLIPILVC